MTGIGMAIATSSSGPGEAPPPPPAELEVNAEWQGAVPYRMTSASGVTTGYGQWFAANYIGGHPPINFTRTIIDNPSGKLGLATAGSNFAVTWSGMAVNELQYLTIKWEATDASGNYATASDSCVIQRTS